MKFQYEKARSASKYGVGIRIAFGLIAIVPLLGCCCKQVKSSEGPVPVPVQSERILFSLPVPDTEKLAAAVSCLIRTGSADKDACKPTMPVCNDRPDDEMRSEYRPVVSSLNRFEFSSPFAFNNAIRSLIGGDAMGTLLVADARRTASCREWEADGACGALRYKGIWFLLKRRDAVPGPAQELEVFLAGQPCRGEVTHADAR